MSSLINTRSLDLSKDLLGISGPAESGEKQHRAGFSGIVGRYVKSANQRERKRAGAGALCVPFC